MQTDKPSGASAPVLDNTKNLALPLKQSTSSIPPAANPKAAETTKPTAVSVPKPNQEPISIPPSSVLPAPVQNGPYLVQANKDGVKTLIPVPLALINGSKQAALDYLKKQAGISLAGIDADIFEKVSFGSILNHIYDNGWHRLEKIGDGSKSMTQLQFTRKYFERHDRTASDWRKADRVWKKYGPKLVIGFSHYSQLVALDRVEDDAKVDIWNPLAKDKGRAPTSEEIDELAEAKDVLKPKKARPQKEPVKSPEAASLEALAAKVRTVIEELRNLAVAKQRDTDWNRVAQLAQRLQDSLPITKSAIIEKPASAVSPPGVIKQATQAPTVPTVASNAIQTVAKEVFVKACKPSVSKTAIAALKTSEVHVRRHYEKVVPKAPVVTANLKSNTPKAK